MGGPGPQYKTRSLGGIIGIAVHHSGYSLDDTAYEAANYHMNVHGWPGIGYTWFCEADRLIRCWPAGIMCYGVAGQNDRLESVCFAGDFTDPNQQPTDFQRRAYAWLIPHLLAELGREAPVAGHGGWARPDSPTACPGALLRLIG